jgi:CheY-like chemotaxis protein
MISGRPITILLADDDAEDRQLLRDALVESRLHNQLFTVNDGEELLDFLHHRGVYCSAEAAPRPGLILLDLAMPKLDGREALEEIKSDPDLRKIPVVVMTTSSADEDICRSYDLGASSYITKPVTFDELVKVMRAIGCYWFEIVELPGA